jgi:hypothetical protein
VVHTLGAGILDLVSAYSKRADLLVDLVQVAQNLQQVAEGGGISRSVRSIGRVGQPRTLRDRLTDAAVREIALSFQIGTPRYKIAAQFGISVSSVGRLLRRWRDGVK